MAALMGRQSATGKHMLELSENTAGEELGHFKISMSAALRQNQFWLCVSMCVFVCVCVCVCYEETLPH